MVYINDVRDVLVYHTIVNITKFKNLNLCDIIRSFWVTKNYVQLELDEFYDTYKTIFISYTKCHFIYENKIILRITQGMFKHILFNIIKFTCEQAYCMSPLDDINNDNINIMSVYNSSIYGISAEYLQFYCNIPFKLDNRQLEYISTRGGLIGPNITLRQICNKIRSLQIN